MVAVVAGDGLGLLTGPTADGDGDGWRWDGERSVTLTSGTLNQARSQPLADGVREESHNQMFLAAYRLTSG
jgi:hypothetical protein